MEIQVQELMEFFPHITIQETSLHRDSLGDVTYITYVHNQALYRWLLSTNKEVRSVGFLVSNDVLHKYVNNQLGVEDEASVLEALTTNEEYLSIELRELRRYIHKLFNDYIPNVYVLTTKDCEQIEHNPNRILNNTSRVKVFLYNIHSVSDGVELYLGVWR